MDLCSKTRNSAWRYVTVTNSSVTFDKKLPGPTSTVTFSYDQNSWKIDNILMLTDSVVHTLDMFPYRQTRDSRPMIVHNFNGDLYLLNNDSYILDSDNNFAFSCSCEDLHEILIKMRPRAEVLTSTMQQRYYERFKPHCSQAYTIKEYLEYQTVIHSVLDKCMNALITVSATRGTNYVHLTLTADPNEHKEQLSVNIVGMTEWIYNPTPYNVAMGDLMGTCLNADIHKITHLLIHPNRAKDELCIEVNDGRNHCGKLCPVPLRKPTSDRLSRTYCTHIVNKLNDRCARRTKLPSKSSYAQPNKITNYFTNC